MNAFKTSVSAFDLTDPFGPFSGTGKTSKQQQQQPAPPPQQQQNQPQQQSFANFDNNPIFNSGMLKCLPMRERAVFSPSWNRCIIRISLTLLAMTSSASFPSAKSQAPSEDKYAALKDLDCLMKMQQQESQSQNQTLQGMSQMEPQITG